MPKPLSFDDAPKKTTPAAASTEPKALDFGGSPARTPAKKETAAAPAPQALSFPNRPAPPPPPPARTAGQPLFDNPLSREEQRAVEYARSNFASIFEQHETSITNGIRQLLPFKIDVVGSWGRTALENQSDLVQKMSTITRDFHKLNIAELLEDMLQLPSKMGGGLLGRFANPSRTLSQHKLKALGVQQHLNTLFPQVEALHERMKKEGSRIPVLMVALSAAASLDVRGDSAVEVCINNRRTMLQQATIQLQTLTPQIQSIREQLVDYQGKLEHMLVVALPALESEVLNRR